MGFLFISHSSRDNPSALEVQAWLRDNGWGESFLDLDPEHGIAPGQRWLDELKKAGEGCSAVVALISPHWLESVHCRVEAQLASQLGKPVFGVLVAPTPLEKLPPELTAHYQLVDVSTAYRKADGFERLGFGLQRAGLDPRDFPWPPPGEPNRPAYRGLRALEEKDAGIFFGRDAAITGGLEALRRMRDGAPERLLAVLGASGAGKSSFLKAGLLARLLRDERSFLVLPTLRPERAALTGAQGLLKALGLAATPAAPDLAAHLAALRDEVVDRLSRHAAAARDTYQGRPPTLVLPVDQAEELFAGENPEAGAAFELLQAAIVADGNLVAVLTIRSESFSKLQNEPTLAAIPRQPFDLPRLTAGAFKEVIEAPGRLARPPIAFDPGLTERLLAGLDGPDSLPLLAFTLERLVADYGAGGRLELSQLEEGLGGIAGAIEKAVEAALAAARQDPGLPADRPSLDALARRAFLPWLVTVDDADAPPKRRIAAIRELPQETHRFVGHLVDQRLLVSDQRDGEKVVEVSHEAVLRHWSALATWIEEEREALRTLAAVQTAAREWQRRPADPAEEAAWLVHRGPRLIDAESLLLLRTEYRQLLAEAGREYLAACRRRENIESRESERRAQRERDHLERQRRLQKRVAIALVLIGFMVAMFGIAAVLQTRATHRQASAVLVDYARRAIKEGDPERGMRLAILAARENFLTIADPAASPMLASAAHRSSLILELRGHEGEIDGVAVSPDGKLLLSWGEDGTARVWDISTGVEVAVSKHRERVSGALFDAGGLRILSWSEDGVARIWSASSGAEIASTTHQGGVHGALFDATGKRVLSWAEDGVARVWNAETGAEIAASKGEPTESGGATFDDSGRRILSWSGEIARVWDAATGVEMARSRHEVWEHSGGVDSASFDSTFRRVLSVGHDDGIVRVWDAATGAEISSSRYETGSPGASFDPLGERVVSWSSDSPAVIWNAATGAEIALLHHEGGTGGAMFDAFGQRVLSWGFDDAAARVWDTRSGKQIAAMKHQGGMLGATFDAGGKHVLSWSADGSLRIWDAGTGDQVAGWRHPGVATASFDAAGNRVLSWSPDGKARLWNIATDSEIAFTQFEAGLSGAIFDPRGETVVSWGENGIIRLWSSSFAAGLAGSKHDGEVLGARFGRAGSRERVLSWSKDGIARVWDAASGVALATVKHLGEVAGAVFDATGERVLSWDKSGELRIWSSRTGALMAASKHNEWVRGAQFDAEGQRVLSWGGETARIWKADTGAEIASTRHSAGVAFAVFDPSGRRVLSWGFWDGIARVWDAETGAQIAVSQHENPIVGAMFDGSGKRVLCWGYQMSRIWDAASGADLAKSRTEASVVEGSSFDLSGRRVLSWDNDGKTWIWNSGTGAEIASSRFQHRVEGAVFDPGEKRVLAWSDNVARVWDAATGNDISAVKHRRGVEGAGFDTEGKRVLSWGEIGKVWNSATGAELAALTYEGYSAERENWEHGVVGAKFDSTSERVLSWSWDGSVRIFDAVTGVEMAAAKHTGKVEGATFDEEGGAVLSWGADGIAQVLKVGWTVPRSSNRALINEVCERKLRGPDSPVARPNRNGAGAKITQDSVRRISQADAQFAPILRDRVGEDVCAPTPWWKDPGWRVLRAFGTAP